MSYQTKKEIQNRLKALSEQKQALETEETVMVNDREIVNLVPFMLEWNRKPLEQRDQILAEWSDYFDKVKQSRAYQRLQEQREAIKNNDRQRIRELAKEAHEESVAHNFLPKPLFPNPADFNSDPNCLKYLSICHRIKEIQGIATSSGDDELIAESIFSG